MQKDIGAGRHGHAYIRKEATNSDADHKTDEYLGCQSQAEFLLLFAFAFYRRRNRRLAQFRLPRV